MKKLLLASILAATVTTAAFSQPTVPANTAVQASQASTAVPGASNSIFNLLFAQNGQSSVLEKLIFVPSGAQKEAKLDIISFVTPIIQAVGGKVESIVQGHADIVKVGFINHHNDINYVFCTVFDPKASTIASSTKVVSCMPHINN